METGPAELHLRKGEDFWPHVAHRPNGTAAPGHTIFNQCEKDADCGAAEFDRDISKPPVGICCEDVLDFLTSSCTNLNKELVDNYMFNAAKCRYKPNCISQAPVTPKCFQAISRPTQGYCYATTTSFNTCVLNQGEADAYGAAVAQVLVPLDTFAAFFRSPPFLEVENRIFEKGSHS